MNYKIRISSLAKSHIKEAVSYYKKEASLKVAQNFVTDYEQTLQKIKQNPFFKGIKKISEVYLLKNIRISFSFKLMKTEN